MLYDLYYFISGGVAAYCLLLYLARKGIMAQKKKKPTNVDWADTFDHNGKLHAIEGRYLDMSGELAVRGIMKKNDPDLYWRAELALIGNTIESVKVDGELKWKSGDASHRLPSEDDPETGESTGEVLLRYIVTKHQKNVVDKWPEVFEEYYDKDLLSENGNDPVDKPPKPTLITPSEPTE